MSKVSNIPQHSNWRAGIFLRQQARPVLALSVLIAMSVALLSIFDRLIGLIGAGIWGTILVSTVFRWSGDSYHFRQRTVNNFVILIGYCLVAVALSGPIYLLVGVAVDAVASASIREIYWRGFETPFEALWRISAACAWGLGLGVVPLFLMKVIARKRLDA